MQIAIFTTGGTIEKTYNESDGTLANVGSVLHHILGSLRHHELETVWAGTSLRSVQKLSELEVNLVGNI